MRELSRRQLLGYAAIGVAVVLLGAWWVRDGQRGATAGGGAGPPAGAATTP
ncbi:MAG: twin-arginine translocation signal domain-containing protein, partial [Solirubrobacteraceae bacterium]|nr:twin-arginine translocation signal domain-containing protein [Solirubrobacteraceae bacterium]